MMESTTSDLKKDQLVSKSATLPKSFSPKRTRPKLPSFKDSRPHGIRHKTDPGRGNIKAILEDIKNLNEVDFVKTYGRPHLKTPHSERVSSSVSPVMSPSSSSPPRTNEADSLNRQRSRSLKLLTDKLKSGRLSNDQRSLPSKPPPETIEDSREIQEGDVNAGEIPGSSEHFEQAQDENLDENLNLRMLTSPTPSTDSGTPLMERSADSIQSDFENTGSYPIFDRNDDEEGLSDDPHSASFKYHPIDRNSTFLKMVNVPPKRRTGMTMLRTLDKFHAVHSRSGDDELLCEEESNKARQNDGQRDVTFLPHKKATYKEEGCIDSNGFGSLKPKKTDTPSSFDDMLQSESQLSFLASLPSINDPDEEDLTCQSAVDAPVKESTDAYKLDRKNNKSLKHKSKSDPCGDKTRELIDFSAAIAAVQSQSSPILLDGNSNEYNSSDEITEITSPLSADSSILVDNVSDTSASNSNVETLTEWPTHKLSTCSEGDQNVFEPSPVIVRTGTSAPSTPKRNSPTALDTPQNLLQVPKKPTSIFRSSSSASVLQKEKKRRLSSGNRGKDPDRKFSMRVQEAKPSILSEFTPLGDPTGFQSTSMPSVWKSERSNSYDSPDREGIDKDKRYHIVEELYRNEKEYVDALKTLTDRYMIPLKTQSSLEESIVDNIFYMIPEILTHHSVYLDFLDNVWKYWDAKTSTVGNILVRIFAKQTVVDSYLSFVENYKTSGKVIENAVQSKSSVSKFIEQCHKESGCKLGLKDLIVRPIQRIPRYELLIQRLTENTPKDHPDYPLLQEAEKIMHELALKIGSVNVLQHEEDMQETLKKLELLLITDLAVPDRAYLRHDMVQILSKKDSCCLWLFSDLIIISSVKRKSGPSPRKVSIILKTPMGQDYTENIKHKVWLRIGLHDIEILKSHETLSRKSTLDTETVEEDLELLGQISNLVDKLSAQHESLEDLIKEMTTSLTKQMNDYQVQNSSAESYKLELLVTTPEGVLHFVITFSSGEKRSSWETTFLEAKQKLSLLSDTRAPEFLQPLQITKTRAGMQFSCAAAIDGLSSSGYRDVWVCNSDGYVGHMCLLSLQPEPIVTLNTPVPGCNSRILCICSVPAYNGGFRRKASMKGRMKPKLPILEFETPRINIEPCDDMTVLEEDNDDDNDQSDSDSSDDDDDDDEYEPLSFTANQLFVEDDEKFRKPVHELSPLTKSTPDPIQSTGNWVQDAHKSTMWLGTEDGCIHIFQCTDNIKTTKNKLKIHHGSPVHCIMYLDNKVFVSLDNGDLIVYKREQNLQLSLYNGLWDTENPYTRSIGSASSPINKMIPVAGKLWCSVQNNINVINPLSLSVEVLSDNNRSVQCMISTGQGVWIAPQQSSKILLYHATTYEFLLEVGISQAVSQKLQTADDIIRQHKAACLRITALLICKDLLWVGTSAGVILTIPLPKISSTTTTGSIICPTVTGLVYGHTGHVRFLTSVELPNSGTQKAESPDLPESPVHDVHRRSSVATSTATMATRMLVISGGDGYEDFRNSSSNEAAGRDDSTNHLLLWQV